MGAAVSVDGNIADDSDQVGGKLVFLIFGSLAKFERALIHERTQARVVAAWARGKQGGRPKKLGAPGKVAMARSLYAVHSLSIPDIHQTLGISKSPPIATSIRNPNEYGWCSTLRRSPLPPTHAIQTTNDRPNADN